MDTFGRTPDDINNYIKELYNSPQIFFTENQYSVDLNIKYAYSTQIYNIPIRTFKNNQGVHCNNFDDLNQFITDLMNNKQGHYKCDCNSYKLFSIEVKQSILIKSMTTTTEFHINHLSLFINAFTTYKNILQTRINEFKNNIFINSDDVYKINKNTIFKSLHCQIPQ